MNRRLLLIVFLIGSLLLATASVAFRFYRGSQEGPELTTISVSNKKLSIGEVTGQNAHASFYVTNTGINDLIINKVEVSCTCSTTTQVYEPVAAGDSIEISVYYTKKIPGYFYSDVIIRGNFPKSPEILSFEGRLVTDITSSIE